MRHIFVVGEKEKHEIEVDCSWTNKVTVKVDGKIVKESRLFRRGVLGRFQIGE